MIHPVHAAVVHPAHPHVAHGQGRSLTEWRNLGRHAEAGRERGAAHAGTIDGLGHDGVGAVLGRPDDDVIGFGHGDLELVDLDWPHVHPVRLDDGHGQAGDPHIEDRHRRGVDDAQADALARTEQAGPVFVRAMTIDQEGVGRAVHVGDVARVHPHLAPHAPLFEAHAVRA